MIPRIALFLVVTAAISGCNQPPSTPAHSELSSQVESPLPQLNELFADNESVKFVGWDGGYSEDSIVLRRDGVAIWDSQTGSFKSGSDGVLEFEFDRPPHGSSTLQFLVEEDTPQLIPLDTTNTEYAEWDVPLIANSSVPELGVADLRRYNGSEIRALPMKDKVAVHRFTKQLFSEPNSKFETWYIAHGVSASEAEYLIVQAEPLWATERTNHARIVTLDRKGSVVSCQRYGYYEGEVVAVELEGNWPGKSTLTVTVGYDGGDRSERYEIEGSRIQEH